MTVRKTGASTRSRLYLFAGRFPRGYASYKPLFLKYRCTEAAMRKCGSTEEYCTASSESMNCFRVRYPLRYQESAAVEKSLYT